MPNFEETGGYFTRNYRWPSDPKQDSAKMRLRLSTYLIEFTMNDSGKFGEYIQRETGIPVLTRGSFGNYVSWEQVVENCSLLELLDMITAICKFRPIVKTATARIPTIYNFPDFVKRVFREEAMAFRVDEKGGIHPFIDVAFSAEMSEIVRHLSDQKLTAAKQSVDNAELALLSTTYDGRAAVRSIFDAVENIFKLICPKSNQLNNANVTKELRPTIMASMADNLHEQRATGKIIDSMIDWIESGHIFRHAAGQPEPSEPSTLFATAYVSQGLTYVRLLADVYIQRKRQAA